MRKKVTKLVSFILLISLTVGVLRFGISHSLTAEATTVTDIQQEIDRIQRELEEEYGKISDLEAEQDLIREKMDDLNAELINTMASIGLKEEELAAKEGEIAIKEGEIEEKKGQIVQTAAEYEAAKDQEEAQRRDMAIRTRMLYEQGSDSYMSALLGGAGLSDVLNRMDYIEKIYEYSKFMLDAYMEAKDQIQDLWDRLEEEKADLELYMQQLEADREYIKRQESALEEQRANMNAMMAVLERESANYDAEISRARQEAAVAQQLLKQNQDMLEQMLAEQMQEEQTQTGQTQTGQNASSGTYTSNYAAIINNASGSDLGKKIANYACQYIGNPYKLGGTSLTDGADCSGFMYTVYGNFGYKLPRTSYEQRSAGTGVSYENAQPGDILCYEGHVAMYIGEGLIVHASNSSPYPHGGIKVSNAQYRTILAVRRII